MLARNRHSLALQNAAPTWPVGCVVDFATYELEQRKLYAQALAAVREDQRMTQQEAADAFRPKPITVQAWQNYEYAKRKFTRDLIGRVADALGVSVETLEAKKAALEADQPQDTRRPTSTPGFQEPDDRAFEMPMIGRVRAGAKGVHAYDAGEPQTIDFSSFFGPDWRALQLGGESMVPYAEPGGFITYNTKQLPQRNKGCVIITKTGEYYVKRYDGIREGKLIVTELHPIERQLEFDMQDEVEAVYRVGLRVD